MLYSLQVSSAISKFSSENENEKKPDDTKAPPKITRKNNFSSLLQRFSSPEPQDDLSSRKQSGLRRQEACAINSGSSDESRRNTPERSQSLKIKRTPPPEDIETIRGVQRSGSFKSDFMKRRFSPEPKDRRALPNIPDKSEADLVQSEEHIETDNKSEAKHVESEEHTETDEMKSSKVYLCTASDKPSDELAEILNKRKKHVKTQQKEGEKEEKDRITSKKVEKAESLVLAPDEEVIQNEEVLSMLKSRRQETDSKIIDKHFHDTIEQSLVQASETVSEVISGAQEPPVKIVPRIPRRSSHELARSQVTTSNTAPKVNGAVQKQERTSVVKTELKDIDTSLAVLDVVSQDLGDKESENKTRRLSSEEIGTITSALSKVNVESSEQVTTFIKDVRRTSHGKIDGNLVQKVSGEEVTKKSGIMHEKVEQLRKSPERRGRMSPKLLEKVKETEAKLANLGSSNLKRSESYGSKEGERSKPKGILKRAESMKKGGVVVDPELATILQRRRSRHEESPETETGSRVTPSAQDDIQESLR